MRFPSRLFHKTSALSVMVVMGALSVTFTPQVAIAGGCDGLNLFSGVERKDQLTCRLDFGGNSGATDRYRFRLDKKKMKYAVSEFTIDYSAHFNGSFDTKNVEIIVNGKNVKVQEVIWEEENHFLKVIPVEPIPAGTAVEMHFSNVRNPRNNGMFYFNGRVQTPGDVPLLRDLGTWIVEIS